RFVTCRFIEWYVELPGFDIITTAAYCGLGTSQLSGSPPFLGMPPAPRVVNWVEEFRVFANSPTRPSARNCLNVEFWRSADEPETFDPTIRGAKVVPKFKPFSI